MRIHYMLACIAVAFAAPLNATVLDQAAQLEQEIILKARESQKVVAASSDRSLALRAEIEALQDEVGGLEVYERHLTDLIESQNQEMGSLDRQLGEIQQTHRGVVPLMYEMLEGLEQHLHQDMPIKYQTRVERVEKLWVLMARADISDAEKYRRILEAYQIELDYGTKLEAYLGKASIEGREREVEQLHLGRVSLIARSPNRENYWYWSTSQGAWLHLDPEQNGELDRAFLLANKQTSPQLLLLPLSQQEVR